MAKKKTGLVELPPEAPAPAAASTRWRITGVYGHAERVVEAPDREAAWAEFCKLDQLIATESRPVIEPVQE